MDAPNFLELFDGMGANKNSRNSLKPFLAELCSALLLLPSLVAFMMNLNDVEQALEALYYFSVQLLVNAQFVCILSDRQGFNKMWNQVKLNVMSRTENGHGKPYWKADKLFELLKKWVFVLFTSTATLVLAPSLFITIYNYYEQPEMKPNSWNLPFLLALPFSITNVFNYSFVYIISVINMLSNMICKIAIQEIYIRTGFHLIASCHDIRDSFSHIDTIYDRHPDNSKKNMERLKMSYEAKRQVRDIIKYHGEMNKLFQSFSTAISGIIFFEYTINIILLGSVGVFVSQDANIWNTEGNMLKFKFVCASAIASLLISSMLGSEITYQQMKVAKYVYLTNWCDWPIEVKKYIPMILMIGQRIRSIHGFGIVLCDLETFKATLNSVVSVIIILKQME